VPAKVVSEQLGHASSAFTLDVYAHVLPHMQSDAATRVAALLGMDGREQDRAGVFGASARKAETSQRALYQPESKDPYRMLSDSEGRIFAHSDLTRNSTRIGLFPYCRIMNVMLCIARSIFSDT
jgi:hypothetical protein